MNDEEFTALDLSEPLPQPTFTRKAAAVPAVLTRSAPVGGNKITLKLAAVAPEIRADVNKEATVARQGNIQPNDEQDDESEHFDDDNGDEMENKNSNADDSDDSDSYTLDKQEGAEHGSQDATMATKANSFDADNQEANNALGLAGAAEHENLANTVVAMQTDSSSKRTRGEKVDNSIAQFSYLQSLDWEGYYERICHLTKAEEGSGVHICERCDLPICIYGLVQPCNHVFCFTCAQDDDDDTPCCRHCDGPITTLEKIEDSSTIFVCEQHDLLDEDIACGVSFRILNELITHEKTAHNYVRSTNSSLTTRAPPTAARPAYRQGPPSNRARKQRHPTQTDSSRSIRGTHYTGQSSQREPINSARSGVISVGTGKPSSSSRPNMGGGSRYVARGNSHARPGPSSSRGAPGPHYDSVDHPNFNGYGTGGGHRGGSLPEWADNNYGNRLGVSSSGSHKFQQQGFLEGHLPPGKWKTPRDRYDRSKPY